MEALNVLPSVCYPFACGKAIPGSNPKLFWGCMCMGRCCWVLPQCLLPTEDCSGVAVGGGSCLSVCLSGSLRSPAHATACGGREEGAAWLLCFAELFFFSVGVLDLISAVGARRSKTKELKEMSDTTGCVFLMTAE